MPGQFVLALLAAVCWQPPVDAPVVEPFRPPPCTWCPGNRGIDYGTSPGDRVRAVDSGVVTFSGVVAGVRYVVVAHADGVRATYGGLASTSLAAGDPVVARSIVGVAGGPIHFGLREGEHYLDPTPRLGRLEPRLRLVPADGSAPRPAPAPRLRCAAGGAS